MTTMMVKMHACTYSYLCLELFFISIFNVFCFVLYRPLSLRACGRNAKQRRGHYTILCIILRQAIMLKALRTNKTRYCQTRPRHGSALPSFLPSNQPTSQPSQVWYWYCEPQLHNHLPIRPTYTDSAS